LELINLPAGTITTIDKLARELLAREDLVGPSPLQAQALAGKK
jgi:hypothetical protein